VCGGLEHQREEDSGRGEGGGEHHVGLVVGLREIEMKESVVSRECS
jgi:hypothetical protein